MLKNLKQLGAVEVENIPEESEINMKIRQQMFQKSEISFKKAMLIYSRKLGNSHKTVGDCLFSIGILYKHHMRLSKVIYPINLYYIFRQ